jgi:hypothetical protein
MSSKDERQRVWTDEERAAWQGAGEVIESLLARLRDVEKELLTPDEAEALYRVSQSEFTLDAGHSGVRKLRRQRHGN